MLFSSLVSKMIRERKMDFNVLLSSVAQKNGLSSDFAVSENRQEALHVGRSGGSPAHGVLYRLEPEDMHSSFG